MEKGWHHIVMLISGYGTHGCNLTIMLNNMLIKKQMDIMFTYPIKYICNSKDGQEQFFKTRDLRIYDKIISVQNLNFLANPYEFNK
jgi:hypothetical protein